MPDRRTHRGPHPEDARLFSPQARPALATAVRDVSWLLSRSYSDVSSLKLVADHFSLAARQRAAVMRAACSDAALARRKEHEISSQQVTGQTILIDGYNVLTTVEAALAGGVILGCRDGCYRDLASVHGTWRKVEETVPAARLIGQKLAALGMTSAVWYLDRPVSNSGRLRAILETLAKEMGWAWTVELVPDPDPLLAATDSVVTTADSIILNRAARWFNLGRLTIDTSVSGAWILDLS